jgi:hypothetical protein
MKTKAIVTLIAGSFLLLGCATSDHYPISGQSIGIDDQVRYMTAPNAAPRMGL